MNTLNYTNKAGQKIIATYSYTEFNNILIKGKKTLVNAKINGKSLPPFYIDGHIDDSKVKSSISYYRSSRRYLKNA